MAYYAQIEIDLDQYVTYGPYKTRDEARRNLKRICRTKYSNNKNAALYVSTAKTFGNGNSVIGQLSTMYDKKSNRVLYWVYFSDPFGECVPYIMNDNGTLKRKLRNDEW